MILPEVVTFTGADDSVKAKDILKVAKRYPNTEWGILFGGGLLGGTRFPSYKWCMEELPKLKDLNLSAHFCGKWVYDLVLRGDLTWLYQYSMVAELFNRIQLNFHGQQFPAPAKSFLPRIDEAPFDFIFQDDSVNHGLQSVRQAAIRGYRLFDVSHGAGRLPEDNVWPVRTHPEYMGYAGGLGPDNIKAQLALIEEAANPTAYGAYWIDMETKVRSNGDKLFDLKKVKDVCKQVWG